MPVIAAIALRVRDAATACRRALERGAWAVPTRVEAMELNTPAIHGIGASRIYFVDRWRTPPGRATAATSPFGGRRPWRRGDGQ